jgi:hypothetical protein
MNNTSEETTANKNARMIISFKTSSTDVNLTIKNPAIIIRRAKRQSSII